MRGHRHIAAFVSFAFASLALGLAACRRPAPARAVAPSPGDFEFRLNDQFVFQPSRIECSAGQALRLRLVNTLPREGPELAHNLVILRPGADVDAFARAGAEASSVEGYVPASFEPAVLARSPLVHPGQSLEFAIVAPSAPGDYPFVCSFPGHCLLGMRGALHVRAAADLRSP